MTIEFTLQYEKYYKNTKLKPRLISSNSQRSKIVATPIVAKANNPTIFTLNISISNSYPNVNANATPVKLNQVHHFILNGL